MKQDTLGSRNDKSGGGTRRSDLSIRIVLLVTIIIALIMLMTVGTDSFQYTDAVDSSRSRVTRWR